MRSFTLGQFFDVWGVPLDASGIAGAPVGNGEQLRAWVNGLPVKGDPAKIRLAEHQEIALVYGTRSQVPKKIPAAYSFAPGL